MVELRSKALCWCDLDPFQNRLEQSTQGDVETEFIHFDTYSEDKKNLIAYPKPGTPNPKNYNSVKNGGVRSALTMYLFELLIFGRPLCKTWFIERFSQFSWK